MRKQTIAKATTPNIPFSLDADLERQIAILTHEWWHPGIQEAGTIWPMECGPGLRSPGETKTGPRRSKS